MTRLQYNQFRKTIEERYREHMAALETLYRYLSNDDVPDTPVVQAVTENGEPIEPEPDGEEFALKSRSELKTMTTEERKQYKLAYMRNYTRSRKYRNANK